MIDDGAATTFINADTAVELGLYIHSDPRQMVLNGFQKTVSSKTRVKFVIAIVSFTGINQKTRKEACNKILTLAVVVDNLYYPMLIGSNLIDRHRIVDMNETTLHK